MGADVRPEVLGYDLLRFGRQNWGLGLLISKTEASAAPSRGVNFDSLGVWNAEKPRGLDLGQAGSGKLQRRRALGGSWASGTQGWGSWRLSGIRQDGATPPGAIAPPSAPACFRPLVAVESRRHPGPAALA